MTIRDEKLNKATYSKYLVYDILCKLQKPNNDRERTSAAALVSLAISSIRSLRFCTIVTSAISAALDMELSLLLFASVSSDS